MKTDASSRARALRMFLSALPIAALGACSSPEPAASESAIRGGSAAPDAALDAIGAIVDERDDKTWCTATLISPRLILTAKHCVLKHPENEIPLLMRTPFAFRIGEKGTPGSVRVKLLSAGVTVVTEPAVSQWGSDVGIYTLAEPVEGIAPLRVADHPLDASEVGRSFLAVGFGFSDADQTASGERRQTTLTLRAVSGQPFALEYGSKEAFIAATLGADAGGPGDVAATYAEPTYDKKLLEGYEAYLKAAAPDECTAQGDSGGPLLERSGDTYVVRGTVSAGVYASKRGAKTCRGTIYATFGPKVQELLAAMRDEPCGAESMRGRCDGNDLVRCSSPSKPRAVERTTCTDQCVVTEGRANCQPPVVPPQPPVAPAQPQ